MKSLLSILFLTLTFSAFSQSEIMDSIEHVRSENKPELGKLFCTEGYWNAETDGGAQTFRKMCKWGTDVKLKLNKEQKKGNRSVLTVDFYRKDILRDRVYIYLDKASGSWLMDGLNETERLIKHYLDGFYTGHFSPTDLPGDNELKKLGTKIISFGQNEAKLTNYLQQNIAPETEFGFVRQLVDKSFEAHTVESYGYDKRLNKGYIHFKGKEKENDYYYSNITIYVSKTESGKIKILKQNYSRPWASSFF